MHRLGHVSLSLGLIALGGCLDEAEPPTATATAAIGTSSCVYGSIARTGNRITGWTIDLCNGVSTLSQLAINNGGTGHRDLFYGNCEYWEGAFIWCSADSTITVSVNGQSYTGRYGFDIDPYAGGQISSFNSTSAVTGDSFQDTFPFVESF
jgi:hypothetical protein